MGLDVPICDLFPPLKTDGFWILTLPPDFVVVTLSFILLHLQRDDE
jgi:hypothetical protein